MVLLKIVNLTAYHLIRRTLSSRVAFVNFKGLMQMLMHMQSGELSLNVQLMTLYHGGVMSLLDCMSID